MLWATCPLPAALFTIIAAMVLDFAISHSKDGRTLERGANRTHLGGYVRFGGLSHAAAGFRSERRSQKSWKRPLSLLQRRAMTAFAPLTVQCMPDRLSRVPTTNLQPDSTTPVEVQKPCW